MRINCVTIEDEPLARQKLKHFIEKIPTLNLLGDFDSVESALDYLADSSIDLLFLDINLTGVSGIELLETSQIACPVVITTAYQEYAIKGYELNVTDYMLKPYTFERFAIAVDKVEKQLTGITKSNNKTFFFVKTGNRFEKIKIEDILYIEGMRDYRRIHTINAKIMTLQNFSDLERILHQHQICRIHKSYMVAISKINRVEKNLVMVNNQIIPISETYKKRFLEIIAKAG